MCKKLPKLEVLVIREAYELEVIFKGGGDDQKVEIPNLKVLAFVNLPKLCQTQGIQFQAVKHCFVQNCQKLNMTAASTSADNIYELDYETRENTLSLLQQLGEEAKEQNFAAWINEVVAAEHKLTSSQKLMNKEQSTSKQSLMNKQYPGEDLHEDVVDLGDLHKTTQTNNDQVSLVSSTIEQQFPKDGEIIVSKSRPSSTASQFPLVPSKGFPEGSKDKATSGYELTSSQEENGIESNIPGLDRKMKLTAEAKQEFVVNVSGLEIPSVENSPTNSQEQELMNEQSMDQCSMNQQRPLGETDATVKSSQEYSDGQITIPSPTSITETVTTQDMHETTKTNDYQVSQNDGAVMKVS
ncbi:hypothetical protein TSUD_124920 [Trifolium subterraneum]|uniref:Uncharacterized protein n=1 Tax=Trifolium subterraneum TaxID=3900 RepID=A0A2Z6LLA2_TRISU|nr:hypothetical protein TSUD_124920 [Trifolium subterraneum]